MLALVTENGHEVNIMRMNEKFDDEMRVRSPLWADQGNYLELLDFRLRNGDISEEEFANLKDFAELGYCIINLDLNDDEISRFLSEVEFVWRQKPDDLLAAVIDTNGGRPVRMGQISDGSMFRKPGGRIIDLHSHSGAAKSLFLNKTIHRYCELIIQQRPVATQSLYFEYGSCQSLHRDPWFVVTNPIYNMVAAWIALEDIKEDSGPLTYVPRSHRLPYYLTSQNDIILHNPKNDENDKKNTYDFMHGMIKKEGLKVKSFCAKKGQALLWHYSLVHGGSPVINPSLTRKSFVVHFDALGERKNRGTSLNEAEAEVRRYYTTRLLSEGEAVGFDNPLKTL